jgi:3-deoxy-7-phosphoheptulonate synthase
MRVYFEKPRTTVGWKGLINDPYLDGSFRINGACVGARPAARHQPIGRAGGLRVPRHDHAAVHRRFLISWGAIGARTTESQVHRELASGLSCPVGFKNGTDGNVKIAVDAVQAAAQPHHFLAVHKTGPQRDRHHRRQQGLPHHSARRQDTQLRRGQRRGRLEGRRGRASRVHDDRCQSRQQQQEVREPGGGVVDAIAPDRGGRPAHLRRDGGEPPGRRRQDLVPGKPLVYGQSITDACIDWDSSVTVLERLADAVRQRRRLHARHAA